MGYQRIINLIGDTGKNRQTRKWVSINDDSYKKYNSHKQINFNTSFLRSDVCNFSKTFKFVKGTIRVQGADEKNESRQLSFENCAPYTSCISEIKNTQVDSAKDFDKVMSMYNLLEYNKITLKYQRFYQ